MNAWLGSVLGAAVSTLGALSVGSGVTHADNTGASEALTHLLLGGLLALANGLIILLANGLRTRRLANGLIIQRLANGLRLQRLLNGLRTLLANGLRMPRR